MEELFDKFLNNVCTAEELEKLFHYFRTSNEQSLLSLINNELDREEVANPKHEQKLKLIYKNIQKQIQPPKRLWPKYAVAASLLIAAGTYFIARKVPQPIAIVKQDIRPGHNQATLTLANGKKIFLTNGLKGLIATQNKTLIQVSGNNITYNATKDDKASYNTLTTVRGEQSPYPLILADGSKVWLNSASSITFPTAFNQKERIVKITGEAYFEVKHDPNHPFKVQTAAQTIEDIGTEFDVQAYADEKPATTLISGSIQINHIVIMPGQQTDGKTVTDANTAQAIAWKNHDFDFENDNIQTIMRQLARWYDIDVVYKGAISSEGFNAQISRTKNISAVLRLLEKTQGVRFKIEGRRVTVIE